MSPERVSVRDSKEKKEAESESQKHRKEHRITQLLVQAPCVWSTRASLQITTKNPHKTLKSIHTVQKV